MRTGFKQIYGCSRDVKLSQGQEELNENINILMFKHTMILKSRYYYNKLKELLMLSYTLTCISKRYTQVHLNVRIQLLMYLCMCVWISLYSEIKVIWKYNDINYWNINYWNTNIIFFNIQVDLCLGINELHILNVLWHISIDTLVIHSKKKLGYVHL